MFFLLEVTTFSVGSSMAGGNHGIPHSLLLNHVIEDKWLDVRPTPKSSNKLSNMSDGSWKVKSCRYYTNRNIICVKQQRYYGLLKSNASERNAR